MIREYIIFSLNLYGSLLQTNSKSFTDWKKKRKEKKIPSTTSTIVYSIRTNIELVEPRVIYYAY